ncbi:MAG: hypothetical protein KDN22_20500 [Verrucomicrobiae bacterium]|nr:hypothetical protein [Verrucomicrobiae bacterium]
MSASSSRNKANRLHGPSASPNGASSKADSGDFSAFSINEAINCFFRHKWKVIILGLLGLASAGSVYYFTDATYEAHAKLLVRYVVERSPVDTVESSVSTNSGRGGAAVMNTEAEILTSYDIAKEVASLIGADKLLPGSQLKADSPEALEAAAGLVHGNTSVELGNGNVLGVAFRHSVPDITTEVLNSLITVYFKRHLAIHRSSDSAKAAADRLLDITTKLRSVEDRLSSLKDKAKILSVEGSVATLSSQLSLLETEVRAAEADIGGQQAVVSEFEQSQPGEREASGKKAGSAFTQQDVEEYQTFVELLKFLRQRKMGLLTQYTPESIMVQNNDRQIKEAEEKQRELERQFPGIASMVTSTSPASGAGTNVLGARASLAAALARKKILSQQLSDLQERVDSMGRTFREIEELEREKAVAIQNYQYVASAIEKADVDTYLDPSRMPNISIVQKPAGITKVLDDRTKKLVAGLAGGGFALGIALAFFIDFLIDRSVKRPYDIKVAVHEAPMMSIPEFSARNQVVHRLSDSKNGGDTPSLPDGRRPSPQPEGETDRRLESRRQNAEIIAHPLESTATKSSTGTGAEISPWSAEHFIRPYADAIRDRLSCYFEVNKMTHKPKLVALTGVAAGVGTSTLAVSLAASFSETGDGNVLLVDMNIGHPEVQSFYRGKPASSLLDALASDNGHIAFEQPVGDNLYLATTSTRKGGSRKFFAKKLYELIPEFKKSDFDYIIFDMPAVGPISPTEAMAAFMDKVLLVVEEGKTDKAALKQGHDALIQAGADVSVLLNKAKSNEPKWLEG